MKSNINYQKELDRLLSGLSGKPGLLLHACCAPCASHVLEYLSEYFHISVYYYNPNIRPAQEREKRFFWLSELVKKMGLGDEVPIIRRDGGEEEFSISSRSLESEPEGGERCKRCFELRLGKAAEYAASNGFDYFTTSLTVSPHKNAVLINRIGEEKGAEYGVRWLVSDFKKREGYKRSIELCREMGIYRQDYCGCGYPVLNDK